jgi:hypothetical protein
LRQSFDDFHNRKTAHILSRVTSIVMMKEQQARKNIVQQVGPRPKSPLTLSAVARSSQVCWS